MGERRARFITTSLPPLGGETLPLIRVERILLLSLVGVGLLVNLVMPLGPHPRISTFIFEIVLTLAFGLFALWPGLAVMVFASLLAFSFPLEDTQPALLAGMVAVGLVARTCGRPLLVGYCALCLGLLAGSVLTDPTRPAVGEIITLVLIGAVSCTVGLLQRRTRSREVALSAQLLRRAQHEEEVAEAERQRIADELHDVIAHDLTIIAMHAQVLNRVSDAQERQQSQDAISSAANKALTDLRWLLGQMDVAHSGGSLVTGDMSLALDEAAAELTAAGWSVRLSAATADLIGTPRVVSAALARIIREASTNVLKHAHPGRASITVTTSPADIELCVRNDLSAPALPERAFSGGLGTVRMAERVRQLGGTFRSGRSGDHWVLTARLPLATDDS